MKQALWLLPGILIFTWGQLLLLAWKKAWAGLLLSPFDDGVVTPPVVAFGIVFSGIILIALAADPGRVNGSWAAGAARTGSAWGLIFLVSWSLADRFAYGAYGLTTFWTDSIDVMASVSVTTSAIPSMGSTLLLFLMSCIGFLPRTRDIQAERARCYLGAVVTVMGASAMLGSVIAATLGDGPLQRLLCCQFRRDLAPVSPHAAAAFCVSGFFVVASAWRHCYWPVLTLRHRRAEHSVDGENEALEPGTEARRNEQEAGAGEGRSRG